MFGIFRSKKKYEPLHYDLRKYFEQNFLWLNHEFPEPKVEDRKMLLPTHDHFPIRWNRSQDNAVAALNIICGNMQIDPNNIELHFFDNISREINMGTSSVFVQTDPNDSESAGMFTMHEVEGKYNVSIDNALLKTPDNLVAALAHELAHVKLLGEKRLEDNDEMLTDFTTVFFGLGIFNSNASFRFRQNIDRWQYSRLGYLLTSEWAYALALFAYVRYEDNPEWLHHLSPSIKYDFQKSLRYMIENQEEIFKFKDEDQTIL